MKRLLFALLFLLSACLLHAGTFEEKFITYNQRKVTYCEEKLATKEQTDAVLLFAKQEVDAYVRKLLVDYTVSIDTISTFIVRVDTNVYAVTVIYTLIVE